MQRCVTGMLLLLLQLQAFASSWVLNSPYPAFQKKEDIYYTSFTERPKTLDPAKSYSSDEYLFLNQIVEPILQFDYLKRPYELKPLMAETMPTIRYLDAQGHEVKADGLIAYSEYTIKIRKGIYFQPHPAFAKLPNGEFRYNAIDETYLDDNDINTLSDFKYTGTREVNADDFIYQIKRLASPKISSSVFGLLSRYIPGFAKFGKQLPKGNGDGFIDLRLYNLEGVKKQDDFTFTITLKGQYSQFLYWLAMPFFAAIPWEVDRFYSQPGMDDNNISFSWFPIGTGPYQLIINNPNREMVMQKNPNFRNEFFPRSGSTKDKEKGYLQYPGKLLPLTDKVIFTLEVESIPKWNKFLQGYYDASGVSLDSFDQAIHIKPNGEPELSQEMKAKHVQFLQTVDPAIYYVGFNMLDPVVGGSSEKARKLRQAISIAINFDENIAVFYNGRGEPAQGPVPPGLFGYEEGQSGINPYVYRWINGERKRRSIKEAKKLMMEAGYPEGMDPQTGKPLILHYDVNVSGGPDDKALLDWMRKQYEKLGISLNIRATQYNRFQEKMRTGDVQIFFWGWNADYPDPENFLYQLYGGNGKVNYGGENAANYDNPEYNRLFDLMKNRPNDQQRLSLIRQMVELARHDAPWVFGIIPHDFTLSQQWVSPVKPAPFAMSNLKYIEVDVPLRNEYRANWNRPLLWPLAIFAVILGLIVMPVVLAYRKKEKQVAIRGRL